MPNIGEKIRSWLTKPYSNEELHQFLHEGDLASVGMDALLPGVGTKVLPLAFGTLRRAFKRESLEKMKGILPKFRSTEEALEFGARSVRDPEAILALGEARKRTLEQIENIRKLEKDLRGSLQEQMNLAVEGQFYREALEGAAEALGRRMPHSGVSPTEYEEAVRSLATFVREGL